MFFSKVKENLKKTKEALNIKLVNVFTNNKDIEQIIDEIEEVLILSDVGVITSTKICNNLRKSMKLELDKSSENIKRVLKREMESVLSVEIIDPDENNMSGKKAILVVGVNGVGKTTSIGKLIKLYKGQGKKVLVVAADTFRAAAVDQIEIWAKRNDVDIFIGKEMQEPASVVYDATKKFADEDYDILICDTAGRLHNKKNLMDELQKMKRIIDKNLPKFKKEVLMVLDATTGQNGVVQARNFFEKANVNSIFLTKLDSTAKGGVIFSIVDELHIPIKYIGTGETIDDIEEFDSKTFVDSIILI